MRFQIEKGVPMPTGMADNRTKYPFAEMEVGDSFEFEWVVLPSNSAVSKVGQAARQHGKIHQKKFSIKKLPNGRGRVWRVA